MFFNSLTFRLKSSTTSHSSPAKHPVFEAKGVPHRHWRRQLVLPNSESATASPVTAGHGGGILGLGKNPQGLSTTVPHLNAVQFGGLKKSEDFVRGISF